MIVKNIMKIGAVSVLLAVFSIAGIASDSDQDGGKKPKDKQPEVIVRDKGNNGDKGNDRNKGNDRENRNDNRKPN